MADVVILSAGVAHCSVCVVESASVAEIEAAVNAQHPSGVGPWKAAFVKDPHNDYSLYSVACAEYPGRVHYMLEC
jgi:hypothetical protein